MLMVPFLVFVFSAVQGLVELWACYKDVLPRRSIQDEQRYHSVMVRMLQIHRTSFSSTLLSCSKSDQVRSALGMIEEDESSPKNCYPVMLSTGDDVSPLQTNSMYSDDQLPEFYPRNDRVHLPNSSSFHGCQRMVEARA